ncbi:hypothetical protein RAMDARK_0540 [Rickettsia amblyommatis str. Darkwater]|nr:hypothetical protein RAMDARK_0540 [Rickettsia amblyommatis str. Darkwater]
MRSNLSSVLLFHEIAEQPMAARNDVFCIIQIYEVTNSIYSN